MIKTRELADEVGIPPSKLYYLEMQGYVKPQIIPRGERNFRLWTESDLATVRAIWKYWGDGYRLKIAYRKAMNDLAPAEQNQNTVKEHA